MNEEKASDRLQSLSKFYLFPFKVKKIRVTQMLKCSPDGFSLSYSIALRSS